MKLLLSGSSGLVGSALLRQISAESPTPEARHEILRLVRRASSPSPGAIPWDPQAGRLDASLLEGIDAVVHLAGENIGDSRWTAAKKERILKSRVEGTRLLSGALAGLNRPPRVLLSASAVGYYGNCGDDGLDESSPPGEGFLADVCREWEAATEPAANAGIRVVHMRTGVVLDAQGGALPRMLLPIRLGLGGPLGNGRQYVSWITLDDAVGAIRFLLSADTLSGPVNLVAPRPVTNREFTKAIAGVLGRHAILPAPAFALRLALGEMADHLLLASARVFPKKLLEAGFAFRHAAIHDAVRHVLGRRVE